MFANLTGLLLIGSGLLVLTEGYHSFRRLTETSETPARYWWLAGLIGALGVGLMSLGFGLKAS